MVIKIYNGDIMKLNINFLRILNMLEIFIWFLGFFNFIYY